MPNTPNMQGTQTAQPKSETPPKQNVPPQPQAAQPKKIRRVGTFTFGVILLAAGVLLIAHLLVPSMNLDYIIRFSPVVLIFLGIEVLIYAARPDVTVKYDFLSMFACAFILCLVGGASIVSWLGDYIGPQYEYVNRTMRSEMDERLYAALGTKPALKDSVEEAYVRLSINQPVPVQSMTDGDGVIALTKGDECEVNINFMSGKTPDVTTFADLTRQIVEACTAANLPVTGYSVYSGRYDDGQPSIRYVIVQDASWITGMTTEQIAARVGVSYHYNGASFDTLAERDNYIKEEYREQLLQEFAAEHDGEYPGDEYIAEKIAERFAPAEPVANPVATAESAG